MLTRDRLKKKILEWWKGSSLSTMTDGQVQALANSLEDEVIAIDRKAYQRGLEGKAF